LLETAWARETPVLFASRASPRRGLPGLASRRARESPPSPGPEANGCALDAVVRELVVFDSERAPRFVPAAGRKLRAELTRASTSPRRESVRRSLRPWQQKSRPKTQNLPNTPQIPRSFHRQTGRSLRGPRSRFHTAWRNCLISVAANRRILSVFLAP